MEFFLSINSWTEDKLQIQLNFTNPQEVSQGLSNDAIIVKIKNPSLFMSESLQELSKKNCITTKEVPSQLPSGVNATELELQANNAKNTMQSLAILQLIGQFFLKSNIQDL